MKLVIQFLIFCCFSQSIFAQSGYLGRKNYIELRASMVPSYRFQNVVKDDVAKERLKYGNLSYRFSYTRLLARNVELTVGYDFSRMNCISTGSVFNQRDTIFTSPTNYEVDTYNQSFLDDPVMTYHGGTLGLNFYRLGSLAPIGKFIGFSVSYGIATLKEGEEVIVGQRGFPEKDNFFRTKGPIGDMDKFYISNQVRLRSTHIKARIGRNYPLTDNLMLSVGMTFPVISLYNSGSIQMYAPFIDADYNESETSSWIRYSMATVKKYNRITVEAAIRYHF